MGRFWLFTQFAEPKNHGNVMARMREGFTDLAIMLNNPPTRSRRWSVQFGWKHTEALTNAMLKAGYRVHWVLWLDPREEFIRDSAADIRKALKRNPKVSSIQFDVEFEWRTWVDDHTELVARAVAPAYADFPVPIGINSFAMLPVEVKPLAVWAAKKANGYAVSQAYSQDQGKKGQQSTLMIPSEIVRLAYKRWEPYFGDKQVILLNAWSPASEMMPGRYHKNGAWHGKRWGVKESLEVGLKRIHSLGIKDGGAWSEEALSRKSGDTPRKKALAAAAKTRRDYISTLRPTGRGQAVADKAGLAVPIAIGAVVTGLVVAGAYVATTRK